MWPWSTIRSLRLELAQAERGNSLLRKSMEDAFERERSAHQQIKMLTAARDSLGAALKTTGQQCDELQESMSRLDYVCAEDRKILVADVELAQRQRDQSRQEADDLRAQLAAATKNDQRDARGRFTKAVA